MRLKRPKSVEYFLGEEAKEIGQYEGHFFQAIQGYILTLEEELSDMETKPKVQLIRERRLLKQWNYDEPVVEVSTPSATALFAESRVLALANWLRVHAPSGSEER